MLNIMSANLTLRISRANTTDKPEYIQILTVVAQPVHISIIARQNVLYVAV